METLKEIGNCKTVEDLMQAGRQIGVEFSASKFINISGDFFQLISSGAAEDKLAMKELRIKLKEFRLFKKTLTDFQRHSKSKHAADMRKAGPAVKRTGFFGRLRNFFTARAKTAKLKALDEHLTPTEHGVHIADGAIRGVESLLIRLEAKGHK